MRMPPSSVSVRVHFTRNIQRLFSTKEIIKKASGLAGLLALFVIVAATTVSVPAQPVVYNAIPNTLAPNYSSQAFQAQQTAEFGDFVHLGGTSRSLGTVSFTMSNWALQSTPGNVAYCAANPGMCNSAGFYHPFTVSIYNIGSGAPGVRQIGSTVATVTQTKFVPWRPVADPTCPGGTAWRAANSLCYNGLAFNLTFDMSSLGVTLPNDIIVGIAYNTQTWGASPLGVDGPYNSLNVSVVGSLTAGTDDNTDNVFWNTSTPGNYTDGGAAGVGIFREDSSWGPTFGTTPIQITTVNTLLVRPSFPLDWTAFTTTGGTVGFVTDPTAPAGTGALNLITANDNNSRARYTRNVSIPLSDVFQLSYHSKTNAGIAEAAPSYAIGVYLDGTPSSFTNFVFEPYWSNGGNPDPAPIVPGTWQEWDVYSNTNLWATGNVNVSPSCQTTNGAGGPPFYSLAAMKVACPNAVVVNHSVYMGSFNPNWNTYVDLVRFNGTTWDFEPDPSVVVVDDDGMASAADCEAVTPASNTIQGGVNAALPGEIVKVCPGNYIEDVNVNKANLVLQGSGAASTTITGPYGSGGGNTLTVSASGVTVDGFTITREGNTAAQWAGNTHNQGVNIAASSNVILQNNIVTGNRNGIYVGQSSNNVTIRRNTIDFNRTGIHLVDNNGGLIAENFIRNNWTMGILYRTEGGPGPTALTVVGNHIAGNWYSEIEFREPATGGLLNMSGNYLGTMTPSRVTTPSGEPQYTDQIPAVYGGVGPLSVPPASHPTIAGAQSARVDYSPYLVNGADTDGATPGFQGSFAALAVNTDSVQASGLMGNIQDGIGYLAPVGSLNIASGSYNGNVTAGGKSVSLLPGLSPGQVTINGNLTLDGNDSLGVEINGTGAAQYDNLTVNGIVTLGGATLNLSSSFTPAGGDTFTIVDHDGADAVVGTFAGLAQGATVTVGLTQYTISYVGGTGNDVVLTAAAVVPCNAVSIPTGIPTLTNQQVTVPLNVDDLTGRGVLGYESTIMFDSTKLTYLSFSTVGTLSNGLSVLVDNSVPGVLQIAAATPGPVPPLSGAGVLLNLNFFATGNIDVTPIPVVFTDFMFNEGNPCSGTTNGSVIIISSTISGNVNYVNAPVTTPVPNATISAVGSVNVNTSTDSAGNYTLSGLGSGAYTVTPTKTAQPIASNNGISNVDSTRILQYLVGQALLTANQQMAGDVTGNGTVSNLDASRIAQWSTGIPSSPNFTGTWKFLPATRNYPDVNTPQANQNYDAILMGDVTGNWNPLGSPGLASSEDLWEPTKDTVVLTAPRVKAESGTRISVPITITDTTERGITGYQFDVVYDASVLEPDDVAGAVAGSVSEGMTVVANSPEKGTLKVFVYGVIPMNGEGPLLDLRFSAIGPVGSSTKLIIKNLMLNEGEIKAGATCGEIIVTEPTGDTSLSGRLLTPFGEGVSGARVTLTGSTGERRSAASNAFGYFEFGDLKVGEMYTITVESRRYRFAPQPVSLSGSAVHVDLTPQE